VVVVLLRNSAEPRSSPGSSSLSLAMVLEFDGRDGLGFFLARLLASRYIGANVADVADAAEDDERGRTARGLLLVLSGSVFI